MSRRRVIVEETDVWPPEIELEEKDEVISARLEHSHNERRVSRLEVILIREFEDR